MWGQLVITYIPPTLAEWLYFLFAMDSIKLLLGVVGVVILFYVTRYVWRYLGDATKNREASYDTCLRLSRDQAEGRAAWFEDFEPRSASSNLGPRILEIGIGPGVNFMHYPRDSEVVGVDPDVNWYPFIKWSLTAHGRHLASFTFEPTCAEELREMPANHFDYVVSTFALCSVNDPQAVLREVSRVLKMGGKFCFVEHVEAEERGLSLFMQSLLASVWAGCRIKSDTLSLIRKEFPYVASTYTHLSYGGGNFRNFLLSVLVGPTRWGTAHGLPQSNVTADHPPRTRSRSTSCRVSWAAGRFIYPSPNAVEDENDSGSAKNTIDSEENSTKTAEGTQT